MILKAESSTAKTHPSISFAMKSALRRATQDSPTAVKHQD